MADLQSHSLESTSSLAVTIKIRHVETHHLLTKHRLMASKSDQTEDCVVDRQMAYRNYRSECPLCFAIIVATKNASEYSFLRRMQMTQIAQ